MNVTELEFVNRHYELDSVCNPASPIRVVIDAPTGYGKTHFLKKVMRSYEGMNWKVAYVDLGNSYTQEQIVPIISNLLTCEQIDKLETMIAKVVGQRQSVMILLDSCEKNIPLAQYLKNILVPDFYRRIRKAISLRVIFAGRYLTKRYDLGEWFDYRTLELSPFNETAVREWLIKCLGKLERDLVDVTDFDNDVREVLSLSGGHPAAIKRLADHLVESNWTISWDDDRNNLFENCTKEIVIHVMQEIPPEEREEFSILSILRMINLPIIKEVRTLIKFQTPTGDPMDTIRKLVNIGLLQSPSKTSVHYRDSILRDLLLVEMRVKNPERYRELNVVAFKIYSSWLDGKELFARPTEINLIAYIIELIYHYLQSKDQIEWIDVKSLLEKYSGSDYLKSIFGDSGIPELKSMLQHELINDEGVKQRLHELNMYPQALDFISHFWISQ